jgi:hypothetical protein
MTAMIWAFDVDDIELALRIGDYALRHKLTPPDRFVRDTASLVAEESARVGLSLMKERLADAELGGRLAPLLIAASSLTAGKDMHDQIRAKLFKAIGYAERASGNPVAALDSLKAALRVHDGVGVKKDIEQLERQVKQLQEQQQNAALANQGA